MKIFDLAFKDLAQVLRDKKSLLFLVAMPLVFTLFMGFAYKGGEDDAAQQKGMILAWVEETPSSSSLGQELFRRLEQVRMLQVMRMAEDEAREALQRGRVDGVLIVPAGFDDLAQAGQPVGLTLIADTVSPRGQSLYQMLRTPVTQMMSAVEIARMSAEMMNNPAEYRSALALAQEKWAQSSAGQMVQVEQAVVQQSDSWFGDNPYNQASPGILVQFAIMGLIASAQILVQERKSRTLQRLMTTSMHPWQIIGGHMLAMFALVFLQTMVLVVFGQFLLKVNYLRLPLGTLMVAAALGLWVASMGLLIGVQAKSDDQVVLYAMLAMFIFSALGGTWFPLEASGSFFAMLGKLMPSAWAMTGLQNILMRGLGIESLWLPVLVLLAYAAIFFALGLWRFRKIEM